MKRRLAGVGGALVGVWLAARMARRDERWQAWLSATAALLLCPALAPFLTASDAAIAFAARGLAMCFLSATLGPIYAVYQCTTPSSPRTQVVALHVLVASLGLGSGPLVVGWLNETAFAERGIWALQSSLWSLAPAALAASFCCVQWVGS